MLVKIAFIVLFFAITIFIGFYSRKKSADVNGFLMGDRSVGPWLTAFAYGTSYFSAVIFIGYAGQFGWKYGIAASLIGVGNAIIGSLLAWVFLAKRTRVLSHAFNSATMPDYFGKRFDSRGLKITASIIVFVFLIPYTASLFNGLSRLFNMAFDVDYVWCVIAMAVLTAIYVIVGGYMATAINDFVQGLIMLVGIVVVVVAVIQSKGGLTTAIAGLAEIEGDGIPKGSLANILGPDFLGLGFVVMLTSFGTWGLPQMVQKFYAIKDEKAIFRGTIISTIFAFIVAGGCYFLGGFGRLWSADIEYNTTTGAPVYDSIIPTMLAELSPVIIGLVVILVLSASMSTLSSLVLTSASTLTLDLIQPLKKKEIEEKKKVLIIRLFVSVFIIISSVIAIIQVKFSVAFIAQMMGISWGALAGAFLAPYLLSLYNKKISKVAVFVNFAFGTIFMILDMVFYFGGIKFTNSVLNFVFSSPINSGVVSMAAGFVIVPLFTLIFPDKKSEAIAEEAFEKAGIGIRTEE